MNVYIGSTLVSEYTCKMADQQNWTLTRKSKWVDICFKWLAGCLMFLANSTSKSVWAWNCTVFTKLSIFTILGIWYFCTRSDWVVNEMNTVPEYCSAQYWFQNKALTYRVWQVMVLMFVDSHVCVPSFQPCSCGLALESVGASWIIQTKGIKWLLVISLRTCNFTVQFLECL